VEVSGWSLIFIKGIVIHPLPLTSRMAPRPYLTQSSVQNILGSLCMVDIQLESKADSPPSIAQVYIFSHCGAQEGNITLLTILFRKIVIIIIV
jgi:hypothetical protein